MSELKSVWIRCGWCSQAIDLSLDEAYATLEAELAATKAERDYYRDRLQEIANMDAVECNCPDYADAFLNGQKSPWDKEAHPEAIDKARAVVAAKESNER